MVICQTCGENEAINEYYGECEGCIIEWEERDETSRIMAEDYD